MLEDVLGWGAVVVVGLVMKVFDLPILDPILSIGITIFILYNVFKNLKSIFEIFLEKAPKDIDFEKFKRELIEKNKNIIDIHHTHIWTIDGNNAYVTMHIVVPDKIQKDEIIQLKKYINHEAKHYLISHMTLEIEYKIEACDSLECEVEQVKTDIHKHHH